MTKVLDFIRELKYSFPQAAQVFTEGSCFRLYKMLNILFEAKPWYSQKEGHWVSEINGHFFDINGEIDINYIIDSDYEEITSEVILSSAYIPTFNGQCTSYNKYIKSL